MEPGGTNPGRGDDAARLETLALITRVLDLIPDFFYVHDYDLRYQFANQRAADYFGLPKHSLVGRTLVEVDPDPEQGRRITELCRRIMDAGQPVVTDDVSVNLKGGRAVFRQHDIPFTDPRTGAKMLVGLSRDVTAEKQIEAERLRRAVLEQEMTIARSIQDSLRPSDPPTLAGVELCGYSQPATFAGGDFFDWGPAMGGCCGVRLGDASGHGVGPALLAATCRAYARVLGGSVPLEEMIRRLNTLLSPDVGEGRFVTLAAAEIDAARGTVRVLSAGHGPVFVVRDGPAGAREIEEPKVSLPPLSVFEAGDVGSAVELAFGAGDVLVLVSDGVFDAVNGRGERLGVPRFRELLRGLKDLSPGAVVGAVRDRVREHGGGSDLADDVTVVAAQRPPARG